MSLEIYRNYLNVGARVTIGTGSLVVTVTDQGDGCRIVWDVAKSATPNADTASVKIYNLSQSHRLTLQQLAALKGFGWKAQLEIGYDNVLSHLIEGKVWKIRPEVYESPVDIVSEIEFGDGLQEMRDADPNSISINDGFWIASVRAIARQMGLMVSPQFTAALTSAPNAIATPIFSVCLDNNPRDNLDSIVASLGPGYSWAVQNGYIVMLIKGYLNDLTPPQILSPSTGLLTFVVRDDGGIDATALAHPSVVPGGGVIFQNIFGVPQAAGLCRVETVTFSGDSYSDSTMSILARPLT